MQFKSLLLAAAAAAFTYAQDANETAAMSLVDALNGTESLSILYELLQGFPDIVTALTNATNITVFAPNNDALMELMEMEGFAQLENSTIEAILMYHVVPAALPAANITSTPIYVPTMMTNTTYANVTGGQRIGLVLVGEGDDAEAQVLSGGDAATVVEPDVLVEQGIVHIIDTVLALPPAVEAVIIGANLTALAGAIELAGLGDALEGAEDITIFAPITQAFENIASVLADIDEETLASVLQYHVVAGNGSVAYSSTLEDGQELETMTGESVNITISEGEVFVNSARVIAANVLVAGGVVHFIDQVLNANSTNEADPENDEESEVNFPDATSGALAFTENVPTITSTVAVTSTIAVLPDTYTTAITITASAPADDPAATETSEDSAAMITGAVGAAALFGGAAMLANF